VHAYSLKPGLTHICTRQTTAPAAPNPTNSTSSHTQPWHEDVWDVEVWPLLCWPHTCHSTSASAYPWKFFWCMYLPVSGFVYRVCIRLCNGGKSKDSLCLSLFVPVPAPVFVPACHHEAITIEAARQTPIVGSGLNFLHRQVLPNHTCQEEEESEWGTARAHAQDRPQEDVPIIINDRLSMVAV
jgi:hypothetical protein